MNTFKDFNTETLEGIEDSQREDEAFEFTEELNKLKSDDYLQSILDRAEG